MIPAGQRDMTRVERLVNLLRLQGIEVGRATSEVKLQEGTFPAGSFVIKRDQPYSRLAKTLLEKQDYPDPNLRTYDDTAWTMGLMSQAEVKEIADKKMLDVAVEPVKETEIHLAGTLAGTGSLIAVAHYGSNNMITLRYRLKDLKVQAAEKAFKQGDVDLSRRFVRRLRRCRARQGRSRAARADGRGAAERAAGGDCTISICRGSRSTAPGATRRRSAGCATRSTSSRCRTI